MIMLHTTLGALMPDFTVHLTPDPATFLDATRPFLLTDALANGVLLRVSNRYVQFPAPDDDNLWGWVTDAADEVVLATMHTPPHFVALSVGSPDAARQLAHELAAIGRDPAGCLGALDTAAAFQDEWTTLAAVTSGVHVDMFSLTCEKVIEPPRPAGGTRRATLDDKPLVEAWSDAFITELELVEGPMTGLDQALADGVHWLWEVEGQPVCWLADRPAEPHFAHIGPVYTPPQHRRKGYAAALTYEATKYYLDQGRIGTLYTDAANPTSNGVYESVGYVRVGRAIEYKFTAE
jgi:predicted GNAT family acetyltransferase